MTGYFGVVRSICGTSSLETGRNLFRRIISRTPSHRGGLPVFYQPFAPPETGRPQKFAGLERNQWAGAVKVFCFQANIPLIPRA
jgi:hypothetical protein